MGGHRVSGVVLAGGNSRRFGADKALAPFHGTTLVARAVQSMRLLLAEGSLDNLALADRSRGLVEDLDSVADGPGRGPAAGILGAARATPGSPLLVLACDLPKVPVGLLRTLVSQPTQGDVVPRHSNGDLEPLCALYSPRALSRLAERVARGEYSLHGWIRELGDTVFFLEGDELRSHGSPIEIFRNVNRPDDMPASDP